MPTLRQETGYQDIFTRAPVARLIRALIPPGNPPFLWSRKESTPDDARVRHQENVRRRPRRAGGRRTAPRTRGRRAEALQHDRPADEPAEEIRAGKDRENRRQRSDGRDARGASRGRRLAGGQTRARPQPRPQDPGGGLWRGRRRAGPVEPAGRIAGDHHVMLRSIADIARAEGEDLGDAEAAHGLSGSFRAGRPGAERQCHGLRLFRHSRPARPLGLRGRALYRQPGRRSTRPRRRWCGY